MPSAPINAVRRLYGSTAPLFGCRSLWQKTFYSATPPLDRCGKEIFYRYINISTAPFPWAIQSQYYRLVEAFKNHDTTAILTASANLGHYVADAHVPLHLHSNHRWAAYQTTRHTRAIGKAACPNYLQQTIIATQAKHDI
jgi:hypothetical protein